MVRKDSAKSRLDKIKQKLQKAKLGSGSGFWKPKPGANLIRILPGVGEMDDIFFAEVGTHYTKVGQQWKAWVCPAFTADDACPICEFVQSLYATGDDADKEMARQLRVSKAWPMNVIVRKEEDKGPQVWTPGITIMRQISAMINDPDYGDLIIDPNEGLDITVTRSGQGRQTTYDVTARRKTSPLHEDPDKIDAWLDAAIDITPVELTDDSEEDDEFYKDESGTQVAIFGIMPYERIRDEFEGIEEEPEDEEVEEDDEEVDEDESEGYSDARDAIKRRRSSKRGTSTNSDVAPSRAPRRRRR